MGAKECSGETLSVGQSSVTIPSAIWSEESAGLGCSLKPASKSGVSVDQKRIILSENIKNLDLMNIGLLMKFNDINDMYGTFMSFGYCSSRPGLFKTDRHSPGNNNAGMAINVVNSYPRPATIPDKEIPVGKWFFASYEIRGVDVRGYINNKLVTEGTLPIKISEAAGTYKRLCLGSSSDVPDVTVARILVNSDIDLDMEF